MPATHHTIARALTRGLTKAGIEALTHVIEEAGAAAELLAGSREDDPETIRLERHDVQFLAHLLQAVEARVEHNVGPMVTVTRLCRGGVRTGSHSWSVIVPEAQARGLAMTQAKCPRHA